MSKFIQTWAIMLSIFPTWLAILIMSFMALLLIVLVIKLVAFVLDAIPFI